MKKRLQPAIWTGDRGGDNEESIDEAASAGTDWRYRKISCDFSVHDSYDRIRLRISRSDDSMLAAYNESFEKYNIEDGNFTLSQKASDTQLQHLVDAGVKIYENFFVEEEAQGAGGCGRVREGRQKREPW